MTHITITEDEAGMRLDRWFKAHYPAIRFGELQKLLRSGQIRLDGKRAKTNCRLEAGQDLRLPPQINEESAKQVGKPKKTIPKADQELIRSIVLHEDDALIVLNKPAGLAVQGGSKTKRHIDGMLDVFASGSERPKLVHRLDRDTSGLLLLAKTRQAAAKLGESFRGRGAKKIYWALVSGVPRPAMGEISTFLAKQSGPSVDLVRVVNPGSKGAQHSHTFYQLVEQAGQTLSWIALAPTTGRTHQLRVHMAELGVPIVGDFKYGSKDETTEIAGLAPGLHLHAERLILPHPSGGTLDISAPLPDHMQQSFKILGLDLSSYNPNWLNEF